MERVPK